MATREIPTHIDIPILPGSPSPEPSPTSSEYEDARTQFRSPRTSSTSSSTEDHNDDPEPPYSLVPPEGEIYTNASAHDHYPTPSDDEEPVLPVFRTDTWYHIHPSTDVSLAIDVQNDGRAHIDGKLHLAPAGRFSGQYWNIRRAETEYGSPLHVLATMYLGANMVLTPDTPVRLAPYQDVLQHWRISEHADGTYSFAIGYSGLEGGGRVFTLNASGPGLLVSGMDSEETSTHRSRWRVVPYQTMGEGGDFWRPAEVRS